MLISKKSMGLYSKNLLSNHYQNKKIFPRKYENILLVKIMNSIRIQNLWYICCLGIVGNCGQTLNFPLNWIIITINNRDLTI